MGEIPKVIDMQHHFVSPETLKLVGRTQESDFTVGLNKFARAYEIVTNLDKHLRWMDESNIDMAVLSQAVFCPNGYAFCKQCNESYGEIVRRFPEKFIGMIHVFPLDNKDKNREEIKHGVEDLGLWGIAAVTSYVNMTLDSPAMDHIYEIAVDYDMPIYIHPTIRKKIWGGEKYNLDMTLSREYEIAKSFAEIIYGVLPRFPRLKVVFAHLGGGLPTLKGRLLAWHKPERFMLPEVDQGLGLAVSHADELGFVKDFESKLENILFDSAGYGGWIPVIKSAFETLYADHLCFGSDYPYELRNSDHVKKTIEDIRALKIPEEDKEKFLSGNLIKFFGLTF